MNQHERGTHSHDEQFRIIPVIDLKDGRAVHAVAGRRAYYQPVQSILHATSDPLELAAALRELLGPSALYLADLDAIAGSAPDVALYQQFISRGFDLIVDAGLRDLRSADRLLTLDPSSSAIVAGLETLTGPCALREIVQAFGSKRTIFSLDLDESRPRKPAQSAWQSNDSIELASEAIDCGARHILVLDLARVGTGRGSGTSDLISHIKASHPEVEISAGGGISGMADVFDLKNAGASAVLVASALHDGRIGRQELLSVRDSQSGSSMP
jgi:phosphoribosylformimino-5-aminoimidazole carboxamide ribotide isomerase